MKNSENLKMIHQHIIVNTTVCFKDSYLVCVRLFPEQDVAKLTKIYIIDIWKFNLNILKKKFKILKHLLNWPAPILESIKLN